MFFFFPLWRKNGNTVLRPPRKKKYPVQHLFDFINPFSPEKTCLSGENEKFWFDPIYGAWSGKLLGDSVPDLDNRSEAGPKQLARHLPYETGKSGFTTLLHGAKVVQIPI
jgi:hypothetical protein